MSTQLDFSMGLAKETTYKTAVAPSRFFESEAKLKYDVNTVTGKGLRPTKGVDRTSRNSIAHFEGDGDIELDVPTRGFGFLLNALLGSVTSTLIPTTTPSFYQQNHVLSITDPVPTFTVQEILPALGGANAYPHTFSGCAFDSLELSAKEADTLSAKFSITAAQLSTAFAAQATSYPSDDALFTFVHGSIGIGGTLTEPTTTALASLSGTPAANVQDFTVTVKRNLDDAGWNLGGAGYRSRPPALGKPELSGKLTVEYTDNALRDAYLAQTTLPLVLTFTHDVAVSGTYKPTLQIVLPAVRLQGEVPTSNGGDVITQSVDFTGFDNGTAAQPIWFIYRTLDTAV